MSPRLAVGLGGLVALALSLTACSGDDDEGLPELEPTETASSSLLERIPDEPPPAPDVGDDEAGAKEFSAYVVEVVFYTLATNDTEAIEQIADLDRCGTCRALVEQADQAQDVQLPDGELTIAEPEVISGEDRFYALRQSIEIPAGDRVDPDSGDAVSELDAASLTWTVNVQWVDGAWTLVEYEDA